MLWLAVCSQNMCTPLHQFWTIEHSVKFCDTRSDLVESTHSNARLGSSVLVVCYIAAIGDRSTRHCIIAEKWLSIVMWLHSVGSAKCLCLTIKHIFKLYLLEFCWTLSEFCTDYLTSNGIIEIMKFWFVLHKHININTFGVYFHFLRLSGTSCYFLDFGWISHIFSGILTTFC